MDETSSIMSIRDLIDTAFGDPKINVVNHKLIHAVLLILAKQLRLLERRVEVEIGPTYLQPSNTSLSVTEVKLNANVSKRMKGKSGILSSTKKGAMSSISAAKDAKKDGTRKSFAASTKTSEGRQTMSSEGKVIQSSSAFVERSIIEKSTSDKSSTDKSSSNYTKSFSDNTKTSTEMRTSTYQSTTEKEELTLGETTIETSDKIERKFSSDKTSGKINLSDINSIKGSSSAQDYEKNQQNVEEFRERVLRVIHQRADSREESGNIPTPMRSMDAMEKQYEKLLIVERVPTATEKAGNRSEIGVTRSKTPRLSIVTQTEFEELAAIVRHLQANLSSVGTATFPENAQLMNDLRKGASLTDAMAALQLSARIEAAERALEKMLSVVTDLASKTPGIDFETTVGKTHSAYPQTEVIFGTRETTSVGERGKEKNKLGTIITPKQTTMNPENSAATKFTKTTIPKILKTQSLASTSVSASNIQSQRELDELPISLKSMISVVDDLDKKSPIDCLTFSEMNNAMQELHDEFSKMINTKTNRSNANANNALIIANKIERKLDEALDLKGRMDDLEKLVSDYADQINALDTGLSSQMTNYQEQLTQMQHDLESGLETMAEALANTGGDTAVLAELNNNFSALQQDIDTASIKQKELSNTQETLSLNLLSLWKEIEILRETKSDRDEVADAFKDKAGLAALNGLVSRQEFDAVCGDIEKRIGSAYNKFNNQELIWQKAIDDLLRELNEKADLTQLVSLRSSMNDYLEKLRGKIKDMEDIVGEPRAAAITRKLFRDSDCLSCATPAHMELETNISPPALPGFPSTRPRTVGAEAESKPREDGDHHHICYPGKPIPHVIDPRAHFCHRYCGGSHTALNNTVHRAPPGMIINSMTRCKTSIGIDGKPYRVDEHDIKKPCLPCNEKLTPQSAPEPSVAEIAPNPEDIGLNMTSSDPRTSMQMQLEDQADDEISVTPPPPFDMD